MPRVLHVPSWPAAAAVLALTAGCSSSAPERGGSRIVERARIAMGSELHLTAWTTNEAVADAAFARVFAEFDRLEGLMSVWREGSDIQRLNQAAGDHPVPVSVEVREVLTIARQVS